MLYSIATKLPHTCARFRQPLAKWVGTGDIGHQAHLDLTVDYIKTKDKPTFDSIGNTTIIPTAVIKSIRKIKL